MSDTTTYSPTGYSPTGQRPLASPLRRILLIVGSIALVVLIGYVVVAALGFATRSDASRDISFSETIEELEIDAEVTDVDVVFASVTDTQVSFEQRGTLRTLDFDARVVGSTLRVTVDETGWFPWFIGGSGESRLTITLPEDAAGPSFDVSLESSVGDVTLDGDFGELELENTVGGIDVTGSATSLDVASTVGNVRLNGVDVSADVTVRTTTGDARLDLSTVPASLTVTSTVGDVTVRIPDGSYRVQTDTTVGTIAVDVTSDTSASTVLRFETTVGDIRVSN